MLRLVENAPSGVDGISVRRAVKAVVMLPPIEPNKSPRVILLESENSGRFNIPGGGVKNGETPFETFTREIFPEFSFKLQHLNMAQVAQQGFCSRVVYGV